MRKIFTFIKEAKIELTKVTWPTKDQIIRSTILVVGLTIVMAIFLGGLDYGFGKILKAFIIKQ
jgi:preprotein translocase subunit SecE